MPEDIIKKVLESFGMSPDLAGAAAFEIIDEIKGIFWMEKKEQN